MLKSAFLVCLFSSCVVAALAPSLQAGETSAKDLFAPVFVNRPQSLQFYHCDTARFTFQAVSAATGLPSIWVRYRLVSGPGAIDSVTGEWKLPPTFDPAAVGSYTLEIGASELGISTEGLQNCYTQLSLHSYLPYLQIVTPGFNGELDVFAGKTGSLEFEYTLKYRCDSAWTFLAQVSPQPVGSVFLQDFAGRATLTVMPDTADEGQYFLIRVGATTGFDTNFTYVQLHVLPDPSFVFRISTIDSVMWGSLTTVPVTLVKQQAGKGIGGFDFLMGYDNSALALQNVSNDSSGLFRDCKWEYFTFRFGANGNCSGSVCPSGLVRVIGLADNNNGVIHPLCGPTFLPSLPTEMFRMTFLVTNNRNYICSWFPIRFFWVDCSDNSCATPNGQQLMLSSTVYNIDSSGQAVLDTIAPTFPGYDGAPAAMCAPTNPYQLPPLTNLTFYNGGIRLFCEEPIDSRGDINLNGIQYEVSDMVMLTNYFLEGTSAFGNHVQGSLAASDVNNDGVQADISDLVYLWRVIVGDAIPMPPPTSSIPKDTISVNYLSGVVSVRSSSKLAALRLVFRGELTPASRLPLYPVAYAHGGDSTIVLISPRIDSAVDSGFASGPAVDIAPDSSATIVSASASTRAGSRVVVIIDSPTDIHSPTGAIPAHFALHQNYPNPFNPTTTIGFELPRVSDVTVDVINVLGQVVWTTSGHYAAGSHRMEWNGTSARGRSVSSGVYYYRLRAGDFVETRKMVLLK